MAREGSLEEGPGKEACLGETKAGQELVGRSPRKDRDRTF